MLKRPSVKYSLGTLLVVGFVSGIIFWGGFNTAMEMTNNEEFCISCHEMNDNVFQEYKNTIHYTNRTGVRATCPDCHVPKEWHHKVVRKIQATNELFHKAMGTIDTREKFLAHRLELAKNVWRAMKETDSRECRNCHNYDFMDFTEQGRRAVAQHSQGLEEGKTCIDCHKGIAHELPDMRDVDPSAVVGTH
jgi:cytochrome c-type protein NapC